jgi:molecular chaperone DnaK
VEARNNADSLVYQTEKTLRELGERVPQSERQNIERLVSDLQGSVKGEDVAVIQRASTDLQNAFYALSQQMAASQNEVAGSGGNGNGRHPTQPGNGQANPPQENEGEVIEGSFRDL